MVKTDFVRNRARVTILVAGLACCAVAIQADGPGHSFTSLTSPFTQELYAVTAGPVVVNGTDGFAGGVAFASDGDVWDAECFGSQYHRFDRQGSIPDGHGGSVRQESLVDLSTYAPAPVGCGIVNHPAPYLGIVAVMANTQTGLWPIEADTGLPILGGPLNSANVNAGNGRGIDIDPVSNPTNHVVYAGADCDPTLRAATTCTLWDYDITAGSTLGFARFHRAATESIESLYFSPDGNHVLMSYRDTGTGAQGLIVIGRRAVLLSNRYTVDDAQVIGRIAMSSMPQGVAFRTAGDFALTLNEDGTMTMLTFPSGDFSQTPTQATFASGGFFGGLLRVGADGCIYAPQSRLPGGTSGVRFGDNAVGSSDSVARICGGFAPAPGVANAEWSPEPGSISGSAFEDWNRNGARDSGEPGLSGVPISLSGSSSDSAVSDANGSYTLPNIAAGLYSVSAPATVGDLSGNPTPLAVELGSGEQRFGVDFPYAESTAPLCTSTAPSGSPTRVDFTLRDDSGLRRVVVRTVSNFQVSVRGGAPVSSPVAVDFSTLATGDVSVSATRSNAAQAAAVELDVVDAFGNQVACSTNVPGGTTQPPKPPKPTPPPTPPGKTGTIRRELSGRGNHHVVIENTLAGTMRYIAIHNSRPGLQGVDVYVNRHRFHVGPLRDGQVRSLDVARALVPGRRNTIGLVGLGHQHDSAVVTISDRP